MKKALDLLSRLRSYYQGGQTPPQSASDNIPAILSPGRSTTPRPGESSAEATNRLAEGEDR